MSQRTKHAAIRKKNQFLMFGEITAIYCTNHTEQINKICK
jgi:hypothetical protein